MNWTVHGLSQQREVHGKARARLHFVAFKCSSPGQQPGLNVEINQELEGGKVVARCEHRQKSKENNLYFDSREVLVPGNQTGLSEQNHRKIRVNEV